MKSKLIAAVIASLLGLSVGSGEASEPAIDKMPSQLETQFALSALPPALRERASVYLLDPSQGYQLSRKGTSGVSCLKVIMDAAALRAQGMGPAAPKAKIDDRWNNETYRVPEKAGVS